jgi:hypothetical protein
MPSMSVTKGNGNIKHNLRTQNKKPKNVDFSRTHLNLVLENINIKEAYHELFDNSVFEYNQKQRRTDRKIDDYYSKIIHDKKTKPFHELVIQVGNIDSNIDINVTNKIYTEFVEKFIQNNPQMKVIGAYVHNDEATAHLHLDYIPFASYSRGMSLRVANDRAIEQMGYKSWLEWKDAQFELLEGISKHYDLDRTNMNNQERHQSIAMYKETMRLAEKQLDQIQITEPKTHKVFSKEFVSKEVYDNVAKRNIALESRNKALEGIIQEQQLNIQKMKKKPCIVENEALRENLKKNWSHIHDLEVQNSKMRNIEAENISLKQELNNIKKEHTFMHTFLEQTGLLDVYESYKRMRADKKPLEILMSICESAKESIQKQIDKLEMYLKPTSIKDRLRMAKQTQTERTYEIKIYNTERMEEGSIKVSDKDLAKKLMSVMIDDSEERIAIVDTEANRKLYREMQMDQEKDIDFEMEL